MKIRKSRWILSVLAACAALLCLSSVLPLAAAAEDAGSDPDDIGYSGEIDPHTGRPADEGRSADGLKSRTQITSGVVYDRDRAMYYYTVGETEVGISIPSGSVAVADSKVTLDIPDGVNAKIYRDGVEDSAQSVTGIRDKGNYVVLFDIDENASLRFRIVGELTGALTDFAAPTGFFITKATLNGEDLPCTSGYADLSADGRYDLEYTCRATGVRHRIRVTLDHVAPTLKLEAVENGSARGPVDISDLEKGVSITVLRDGKNVGYSDVLTQTGKYQLTLTDGAGNVTSYSFVIRMYFNASGWMLIVLFVLLAGAVTGFLIWSRKKLRIR